MVFIIMIKYKWLVNLICEMTSEGLFNIFPLLFLLSIINNLYFNWIFIIYIFLIENELK